MARGRSRRHRAAERDHNTIPNRRLPPRVSSLFSRPLLSVSDRRQFHPDDMFAPVFSYDRRSRKIVERNVNPVRKSTQYASPFGSSFGFAVPHKVSLCVRRKQRREVLFALKRTGKGSRTPKRRNYWSDVRC